jgi:DNA-binding transcriptional MerR regulator
MMATNRPEPADDAPAGRLTIRELAGECGVTARTLRCYEEKGLLAPHREGLERLYGQRDRARLHYILMAKQVGFSLDEARDMLDLYDSGGSAASLAGALARIRERIARLEHRRAETERMLAELRRMEEVVASMMEGSGGGKPRIRMKAARSGA